MLIMELFKIPSDINNVLIHTDVISGIKFPIKDKKSFFDLHFNFLMDYCGNRNIFFPSFNYDCLKTGIFNIDKDPIQVGVLNEFIRKEKNFERNIVPVFSFLSSSSFKTNSIKDKKLIDPFGKESLFNELYKKKSFLLHYGSHIKSSTIIHFIERISNKLLYRYDKFFKINVESNGTVIKIILKYHVRPLGFNLDYDWLKLEKELKDSGILFKYNSGRTKLLGIKISDLVDFWLEKLNDDPLYLLSRETRSSVECMLDKFGRGFELNDFE